MVTAYEKLIYYIHNNRDYLNLTGVEDEKDFHLVSLMPKDEIFEIRLGISEKSFDEIKSSKKTEEVAFFEWVKKSVDEITAKNV